MEKKSSIYLIPTKWNSKVPIEYRLSLIYKDMRTTFCRRYKSYELTYDLQPIAITLNPVMIGNRLLFRNENEASVFYKKMCEGGFGNETGRV